jgi:hypothetical protein
MPDETLQFVDGVGVMLRPHASARNACKYLLLVETHICVVIMLTVAVAQCCWLLVLAHRRVDKMCTQVNCKTRRVFLHW